MSDIRLNFYNHSNGSSHSDIVIYQQNEATPSDPFSNAWKVIRDIPAGGQHSFVYPKGLQVVALGDYGNVTPLQEAQNGQVFLMRQGLINDDLVYKEPAPNPSQIQIENDLSKGSISAQIYKGGNLLMAANKLAPKAVAVFEIKPVLFLCAVEGIKEGEQLNTAVLGKHSTKLDLSGVTSADIVMTGGGTDPKATAFQFSLENVVRV